MPSFVNCKMWTRRFFTPLAPRFCGCYTYVDGTEVAQLIHSCIQVLVSEVRFFNNAMHCVLLTVYGQVLLMMWARSLDQM